MLRRSHATWRRYLVLLVLIWLVTVSLAGGIAWHAGSSARGDQESQFRLRTRLAANVVGTYVDTLHARQLGWAHAVLQGRSVTRDQLATPCTTVGFTACGLFDADGRLVMNAPYLPKLIGQRYRQLEQVQVALDTRKPVASHVNISPALGIPVVAVAVPFATPYGPRVMTGIFSVQESALLRQLRDTLELPGNESYVIDDKDNVASAPTTDGRQLRAPQPLTSYAPALASAVARHDAGTLGKRYFAVRPIPGTPWRLVTTVSRDELYAPIEDVSRASAWVIGVWAVAGLAGVLLLARALHRQAQSEARLAMLEERSRERQRYAREVNDTIVQGLVAAETALDLDERDHARRLVGVTSRRARDWIGELLADEGPLQPGGARRSER